MARKRKSVTVYLFGGLGNQLFQYFAGLAIAESVGAKLYLKPFGQTSAKGQEGEVGLDAFEVEGTRITSRIPAQLQEKVLRRFVNSLRHVGLRRLAENRGVFLSDQINLESLSRYRHIRLIGYFQDSKYLELLVAQGRDTQLPLKNPSPWFRELESLARTKNPIALHIRRGDYLSHADSIGVLDYEYFLNALKKIPTFSEGKLEVWIFSDSLSVASDFANYARLPEARTRIIRPPGDSPAAESMLLMAMGSAIVISNSTFSWWGAYLAGDASKVIVPQKWFKGLDDPVSMNPDAWTSSESIWTQ